MCVCVWKYWQGGGYGQYRVVTVTAYHYYNTILFIISFNIYDNYFISFLLFFIILMSKTIFIIAIMTSNKCNNVYDK